MSTKPPLGDFFRIYRSAAFFCQGDGASGVPLFILFIFPHFKTLYLKVFCFYLLWLDTTFWEEFCLCICSTPFSRHEVARTCFHLSFSHVWYFHFHLSRAKHFLHASVNNTAKGIFWGHQRAGKYHGGEGYKNGGPRCASFEDG